MNSITDISINNIRNNISSNKTIIILDDDINIYYVYNTIRQQIYSINKSIDKLKKRLDILIKGPQDVQAQQYDNVIKGGSGKVENTEELLKEISATVDEINQKKAELVKIIQTKKELEELFKEILRLRPQDLEWIVFYRHHVQNISLKKIHKVVRHLNGSGEKVSYHYDYIRQINARIIGKMANVQEKTEKKM
jgi:hypothetical protein